MGSLNVIIKDRIYIPHKYIDEDELNQQYMKQIYNQSKCDKCPYVSDRHCDTCDECPAYLGLFKLYKDKTINGKKYVGISNGNKSKWRTLLKDKDKKLTVEDKRSKPKFRYPIKFIQDTYEYQGPAIKAMVKFNNGILLSPPRSGKTVMGVKAIVKKRYRTLIMASQYDWLEQFYTTIMGDPAQKEKPFTNIPELEEETGKKICVLAKDGESLLKYKDADIVLCTYQRFLNKKGKKELKKIKKEFGTLFVDEVDGSAATAYSKTVNEFYARSRLGCTGTYDRKDGFHFLLEHIFGPILYKVKIKSLKPEVKFIETGYYNKHNYKILPYAYRALADNTKRNELLVDWIMKDLADGHSIVIPTTTVKHCNVLVKMINKKYGKEIACAFTAATAKKKERRTEIKTMAKKGKYRVIVGIRKMVQRGINVPIWSMLYSQMPISNAPNYKQETSRILTPMPGKLQPVIRHFVDQFGFSRGCLRTCVYQTYTKNGFIISRDNWAIANKYLSNTDFQPNTMTPKGVIQKTKKLKGNLI